ncbi:hypothetical protein JXR93_13525 [bacterium]|nr:hypothetical protein [bacterium]
MDDIYQLFKNIELEAEIDKLRMSAYDRVSINDIFPDINLPMSPESNYIYGIFLKNGFKKIEPNRDLAEIYFNKAFKEGFSPALIELGELQNTQSLFEKALKYHIDKPYSFYEKYAFTKMLIFGYGVDIDFEKAYIFLKEPSFKTHPFTTFLYALYYQYIGDIKNSSLFFYTAKKEGNLEAISYIKKNGIQIDINESDIIDFSWDL